MVVAAAVQAVNDCIVRLDAASIHIGRGRQGRRLCWLHLKEWKELRGASRRHLARCLVRNGEALKAEALIWETPAGC
eukprot:2714494-Rhodomonas_salina.1